jgi:glycosyltransferase involved in cell wall biosynthesis
MNNPLVSIIIPTYNRPKYLRRAIESTLKQTHNNIEVLVIDDYSNYNPLTLIEEFNDNRIKYYRNSFNQGSVYSRNRGLSICSGDYINFLDDDDEILPQKIELQLAKFRDSHIENLGVVICDMEYRRKDINMLKKNHVRGDIYKKILKHYCVYGIHSMLIKRDFAPKFDPNLKSSQEYDLSIRIARRCNFDYVPKKLAITHTSENQISFNYRKKIDGTKYIFDKYRSEFLRFGVIYYIFNWFRFRYLLLRYFILLKLKIKKLAEIIYAVHNKMIKYI